MIEPGAVVVLSTFPDEASAARVARALVDEGLVACAQVGSSGVRSWYRWQGEVTADTEFVLNLKTTERRVSAVEARLHELHPYDVPQFVVLAAGASSVYAAWLREATLSEGDSPQT